MGRPLSPSVLGQVAVYLSGADPRCGMEAHRTIMDGGVCPACHLSLTDYRNALESVEWP